MADDKDNKLTGAKAPARKPRAPSKPPPPLPLLDRFVRWVGRFITAYGFIPPPVVGLVTSALAWLLGWPAPFMILGGLASYLMGIAVIKYSPNKVVAWALIAGLITIASLTAVRQYNDYLLTFSGIKAGLNQTSIFRDSADAGVAEAVFINENSFDLYFKTERRTAAIDGMGPKTAATSVSGTIEAGQQLGINSDQIYFGKDIANNDIPGGTFDYDLCYGRSEGRLWKRLSVQGTFQVRVDESGNLEVTHYVKLRKEGKCD